MTAYLCPVFQEPQFTDNDEFLAGGLLWFYEAGTSTLATAYTTETGDVAWSNPIVLDSRGESGGTIWLAQGQAYRIVLEGKPAYGQTHGTEITEHDNITGVNDPSVGATDGNWILFAGEPTYISATSFSVAGDFRDIFTEYRRLYTNNTGGVVYSSVSSASYGSGVTTVVITNDSGTLDVGLNAVYYSFSDPIALPNTYDNLNLTEINGGANPWTDANNTFDTGVALDTVYEIEFANGLKMKRGSHKLSFVVGDQYETYTFTYGTAFPNVSFPPMVTARGPGISTGRTVTVTVSTYAATDVVIEAYITPALGSGGPLEVFVDFIAFGY